MKKGNEKKVVVKESKEVVTTNETVLNEQQTDVVEVKETALTIIPKNELTPEEKNRILEAEIEKLKSQLKQTPQTLEEKIEFYQVKQQKIKQLSKLGKSSDELFGHIEKLEEMVEKNDFECDEYKLSVGETTNGNYREATVFQMNNPIIIRDVIKFVLQQIDNKIDILKMEIAD